MCGHGGTMAAHGRRGIGAVAELLAGAAPQVAATGLRRLPEEKAGLAFWLLEGGRVRGF